MVDRSTQRRLAAILAADMPGYALLLEQGTDGTEVSLLQNLI